MPISFNISKEDLLRSKIVKPGVYTLLLKNVTEGPGKNDPLSNTITLDFVIESGVDPAAVGVPVKYWLSEKAAGLATGFLEAISGKKIDDAVQIPDMASLVGRKVKAYIKTNNFEGRPQNKIDGFVI